MKRYRVLVPFAGEKIGDVLSVDPKDVSQGYGDVFYFRDSRSGKTAWQERILPHEILLMIRTGILEEISDT